MVTLACTASDPGQTVDASTTTDPQETSSTSSTASGSPSSSGLPSNREANSAAAQAILQPSCAMETCHGAQSPAAGLDLSTDPSALVGRPSGTCDGELLIVAGDPDASFLFNKLGAARGCGGPMPPDAPLAEQDIECLAAWIEQATPACETCGGDTCVALMTDPLHCGACDQACPDGIACSQGACACPGDATVCGGACVDTSSAPQHCGGCDALCPQGTVCLNGGCADGCGDLDECRGACVDLDVDPLHCGGCDQPCGAGEVCTNGQCGCDAPATSYANDVEPFFVESCASMGCHRPMGPNDGAEDLDLSQGAGYANLVDIAAAQCDSGVLVAPGSVGSSYLVDKLRGVNLCSGTIMPKNGGPLSEVQIQTVEDWICSGAAP